jgi:trans-feruloyl-CoA hydratase/vanillin synthase
VAGYETVLIERDAGIAWVTLNRPEKRNAMNPTMHYEMLQVLEELEFDDEVRVLVLTGAGSSWCAGQDLKESFQDLWDNPMELKRAGAAAQEWRWRQLFHFSKPTIAMVNGYCFGGGFTQLIACDIALAAEEAIFGLSEVNWAAFPAGLVSRVLADAISYRDAMYYVLTGETFDGRRAAEMRLVTFAHPLAELRERTETLARRLIEKNPNALTACKDAVKNSATMDYALAEQYFAARSQALRAADPSARSEGISQFLQGRYKPGFTAYDRESGGSRR